MLVPVMVTEFDLLYHALYHDQALTTTTTAREKREQNLGPQEPGKLSGLA